MTAAQFPQSNQTYKILHDAAKGGYAVGAVNWYSVRKARRTSRQLTTSSYNDDAVMAVIRAAERKRSPAIIQLFPWSLHFQGRHYIEFVVKAAHAASVPIAVHLDHCIKDSDVQLALELPFDSIMVDASTQEGEENQAYCAEIVQKASARGISIEAEMGRIQGGEDGLANVDMEAIYTTPEEAQAFIQATGIHFLAPSFGNVHGPYPPGGAEKYWQLDR